MIYPNEDYKEYAEKHGIDLKPIDCSECGGKVNFITPIAMKKYRGLKTEACQKCGHESGAFRVVPIDENSIAIWNSIKEIVE